MHKVRPAERDDPIMDRVAMRWWRGWLPLIVMPAAILMMTLRVWPRWATMWALAVAIYALHFGTFQLLSCAWRTLGIEARPLMIQPLRSRSLSEFWGRRWNTAFRDLTHRFLYRPLIRTIGLKAGIAGGFLFSGLVHDLVISVPAGGGYGGPTLFFAVQGAGILLERSGSAQAIGMSRGRFGHVFVLLFVILPAPILFHPPFVYNVVIPFMHALRAL
jgi:D-alanyl-lipoteichoic acid acyltransferase DltB (MBOAT superfamily)